eukprot:gene5756-7947_t
MGKYDQIRVSFSSDTNNVDQHDSATSAIVTVNDLLSSYGYNYNEIIKISNQFPNNKPSIHDIKSLGKNGTQSLLQSIEHQDKLKKGKPITIHVNVPHQNHRFDVIGYVGENLYDITLRNMELSSYLECVCGGVAACSTCHVIVKSDHFSKLPLPEEAELDMIDLAAEVSDTSRLGCQIQLSSDLDGMEINIPSTFINFYG